MIIIKSIKYFKSKILNLKVLIYKKFLKLEFSLLFQFIQYLLTIKLKINNYLKFIIPNHLMHFYQQ